MHSSDHGDGTSHAGLTEVIRPSKSEAKTHFCPGVTTRTSEISEEEDSEV